VRIIILLTATSCFLSCTQNDRHVSIFNTKDFVLIDTSASADHFLRYDEHEYNFPIYYIGKESDTIKIGEWYKGKRLKWVNDVTSYRTRNYSGVTLSLVVDTSIKTTIKSEYYSEKWELVRDSTRHYSSFLLTIKNISDSTIYLGISFSLIYLNREIKDSAGKWIKIDESIDKAAICGTGQPHVLLKPGEILLAKVQRYKGDFVTDCRFVFGYGNNFVYSNTFKDSVDERIFGQNR